MVPMNYRLKLFLSCIVGISCSRPSVIPTPTPVPTFPAPEPAPSHPPNTTGAWHFNVDRQPHSYQSTTRNTVKAVDQSGGKDNTSQVSSWFTISINSLLKPITLNGSIDSAQIIPTVDEIRLPTQFTGSLASNELIIRPTAQPTGQECLSPVESLFGEIRSAISTIPPDVTSGVSWTDSILTTACSGNIRTTIRTVRHYTAQGARQLDGRETLFLNRSDKIQLVGDGAQGQHQVHLEGEGNGITELFVNPSTGILVQMEGNQQTRITITTSGQTRTFTQMTHQLIHLTR
jgi:hypothetical protein